MLEIGSKEPLHVLVEPVLSLGLSRLLYRLPTLEELQPYVRALESLGLKPSSQQGQDHKRARPTRGARPTRVLREKGVRRHTRPPCSGVSPVIMAVSATLAKRVRDTVESLSGWTTKILRPGGGLAAYPPIYLGTHAPFEGSAKLSVETWGVGLGDYLLYEGVDIRLEAVTTTIEYMLEEVETIEYAKKFDHIYDCTIGEETVARYVVAREEVDQACRILKEHRIGFERKKTLQP